VTVPPREYELAARLLAIAVHSDTSGQSEAALRDAARQYGASLASGRASATGEAASRGIQTALRQHGFEPWHAADGAVRLRNCPFRQLAAQHPDVVCRMNLALIDGLLEGFGVSGLHPKLDPGPGRCCVVITDDNQRGEPATTTSTGER
jgi:predicted ArsR family transcriptional regulator